METGTDRPQPKYLQLKATLLCYLIDEHYQPDQKIPTEHALLAQFNVSRGTIRQALAELENEGVLYKIQGSGTFFSGNLPVERKQSHLLGVVTPSLSFYIYPQIIQGITDVAQQQRYHVVLGSSKTSPGQELGCIEQLLAKNIDGLIFEPAPNLQSVPDTELINLLKKLTIPVVFMGTAMPDTNLSYVTVDDVEGGFRATNYLIAAGHRRIACLYPPNTPAGQHRYQGYRNALNVAGIAPDCQLEKQITTFYSDETYRQTLAVMNELFALGETRPTAVFFFNDLLAAAGCAAIEAAGLNVPNDISMVGFDDSELALQARVPLTSMVHPKYYQGKWAAELLFEKLEHPEQRFPKHLLITPTLVERDSVKVII
ncbi:transcriptional repressor [Candidatus Moduliflexus flocculans]|uniref:Transcriptional repressor n=1 Tax=Candidatus Moduliflexus flocculans TaxID=1499966 RepID=A0A081BR61_9BACT|nr:transcriptional repressor [Candidatus Moduliflexus flocculans]